MFLLHWFTRNWADTADVASRLPLLEMPLPPAAALQRVAAAIQQLPRWKVVTLNPQTATITATRTTILWRFVDDITLRLEATPTGSRLHARSQARLGKGDLGQNRRNLVMLFRLLQKP